MLPRPTAKGMLMRVPIWEIAEVRQGMSRSGRSAGARPGEVTVRLVSGNNLEDDRIVVEGLEEIQIDVNRLTEKHLLRPGDVVVTGKSTAVKAAYVLEDIGKAVANSTMIVVRPWEADMGLYLWWFMTSTRGREMVESLMVASATLSSLPPRALASLEVPKPLPHDLPMLGELIRESEKAYWTAKEAAALRRIAVRDYIIGRLLENAQRPAYGGEL